MNRRLAILIILAALMPVAYAAAARLQMICTASTAHPDVVLFQSGFES